VEIEHTERSGRSQNPLFDELLGSQNGGHESVVERYLMNTPRRYCRVEHRARFSEVPSERLLAIDVFSVAEGGNRQVVMRVVGRADVNQCDVGMRKDVVCLRCAELKSSLHHGIERRFEARCADAD